MDSLISDMVKILGVDEETVRDTVADMIWKKDKKREQDKGAFSVSHVMEDKLAI